MVGRALLPSDPARPAIECGQQAPKGHDRRADPNQDCHRFIVDLEGVQGFRVRHLQHDRGVAWLDLLDSRAERGRNLWRVRAVTQGHPWLAKICATILDYS